jgi:hypothetical protein
MARTTLYEDRNEQQGFKHSVWNTLMTDKQRTRGEHYSELYFKRRAEVDGIASKFKWEEIEKLYECGRDPNPDDPAYPNSFIPLITPCIEGQTAHMTTANAEFTFVSDNPAHEMYMRKLSAAFAYLQRQGRFMAHMKDAIRSYLLLGGCWITASWAKAYGRTGNKPDGYARISALPIRSVLVDGRIKDFKDLQDAEYIIHEIGFVPISYIRDEYGEEYGDAVLAGYNNYQGSAPNVSNDDKDSCMLLHVWTRSNPKSNLQLIEMDANGLVLRESDEDKPVYEGVDNEYPFAFARSIPVLGNFYGYGDGLILYPMQKTVNKLTDELELAARYNAQPKLYIDPKGNIDAEMINSDPSIPVLCDNPNQNVRPVEARGVSPVVMNTIQFLLAQADRATRFADIMTGMKQYASETATSTQSRVLQSSVGISDKKADITEIMKWAAKYTIKMCLDKWDAPYWFRIDSGSESVDMGVIAKAPKAVPVSPNTTLRFAEKNPNAPNKSFPKFDYLEKDGAPELESLDFDVKVVIGNEMPRGKSELYNILLSLSQLVMPDEQGQMRPVITLEKLKSEIESLIGIKMDDVESPIAPAAMLGLGGGNNAINPVGSNGNIAQPQGSRVTPLASNLNSVIPGLANTDNRNMQV